MKSLSIFLFGNFFILFSFVSFLLFFVFFCIFVAFFVFFCFYFTKENKNGNIKETWVINFSFSTWTLALDIRETVSQTNIILVAFDRWFLKMKI